MTETSETKISTLLLSPFMWLLLLAVFFLVVTPIAFVMRLAGRDAMHLKLKSMGDSSRLSSKKRSADHFKKSY